MRGVPWRGAVWPEEGEREEGDDADRWGRRISERERGRGWATWVESGVATTVRVREEGGGPRGPD